MAGVVAITRTHIISSIKEYEFLLWLKWLYQDQTTINYGTSQITIQETNGHPQEVARKNVPAEVCRYLPRQEETLESGYKAKAKAITDVDKALQCIIERDDTYDKEEENG